MRAFINTPITKEQFVKQLKWHQEQDAFIRGNYGKLERGKFMGCAVGCSIHSIQRELKLENDLSYNDHQLYEKYLGVPEWIAKLEDAIFEGLPEERRKSWPVEFGETIPVGKDLDKIKHPFLIFVMEENLKTLDSLNVDRAEFPDVHSSIEETRKAIQLTIESHKDPTEVKRRAAYSAADSAARSAYSAARSAYSAADSAYFAADSAARSVYFAARSACSAACSVYSTYSACSADFAADSTARSAADSAAYEKYADKLLELMKGLGMKLRIEKPSWLDRLDDEDYSAFVLWFDSEVEPVNKMLEAGVEVYSDNVGQKGVEFWYNEEAKTQTHRAILINVQEIKKESVEDVLRDYMALSERYPQKDWEELEARAKKALGE